MLAVMLGMMAAGFGMMMFGMAGVTVRAMSMVSGLFVMASFMMLGSFAMVSCGMLVMFGSLVVMMLGACVFAHAYPPIR
jgi:hypothetical protein